MSILRLLCAGQGRDIRDLRLRERAGSLTASRALAVLLVRGKVEGDEKQEVRTQDANAGERRELFTGALAHVRHPGEVGRSKVCVRGEVHESCGDFVNKCSYRIGVREEGDPAKGVSRKRGFAQSGSNREGVVPRSITN